MSLSLKGVVFLAAFFAALALSVPALAQERGEGQEAMLRAVHLSPDAPEVDVYVDNEPVDALSGVSLKTVSSYLPLPAGTRNVKVYRAGASGPPLLEADVTLRGGASYTLGVVGRLEDGSLAAKLYEDDNSLPTRGKTKVRVIHAVPDLGAATVRVKGGEEDLFTIPGFSNLPGFSNASNYAELPAGTYTLRVGGKVRAAGVDEVDLSVPGVAFSAGEVYTVFVVGRIADWSLGTGLTVDSRGGPPLLSTGGPPESAATKRATNNSPTTPTAQEPVYGSPGAAPTPDELEPDYQQPLYREEPFATTPVEPSAPDYQQPPDREEVIREEPFGVTPAEPDYQQLFYQEEPFATTPVEPPAPDYQQPTGELTSEIANPEEDYLDERQLEKQEEDLERQVEKQEEYLERQVDKQEEEAEYDP